ncbi:MAG: hypothetical protein ACRD1Z_15470, partial [Vicinamibacteria bacterium]
MITKRTRISRIGSLAIALALLAGLAPALGAEQERHGRGCSDRTLEGSYGLYRTGTAPYGAVAAQGLMFLDGEGGWQLRLNISRNGELFLDEEYDGTYTVNADCTGMIDDAARFVIVDGGKTV